MSFFTEFEQKILQFVQKHKRTWLAKAILRKKNGAGGISKQEAEISSLKSNYTTKL